MRAAQGSIFSPTHRNCRRESPESAFRQRWAQRERAQTQRRERGRWWRRRRRRQEQEEDRRNDVGEGYKPERDKKRAAQQRAPLIGSEASGAADVSGGSEAGWCWVPARPSLSLFLNAALRHHSSILFSLAVWPPLSTLTPCSPSSRRAFDDARHVFPEPRACSAHALPEPAADDPSSR